MSGFIKHLTVFGKILRFICSGGRIRSKDKNFILLQFFFSHSLRFKKITTSGHFFQDQNRI